MGCRVQSRVQGAGDGGERGAGCRAGCRVQEMGESRVQGAGCRAGCGVQEMVQSRVQSAHRGCWTQGAELRVQGVCRVQGAGCREQGAGSRVQGVGHRARGSWGRAGQGAVGPSAAHGDSAVGASPPGLRQGRGRGCPWCVAPARLRCPGPGPRDTLATPGVAQGLWAGLTLLGAGSPGRGSQLRAGSGPALRPCAPHCTALWGPGAHTSHGWRWSWHRHRHRGWRWHWGWHGSFPSVPYGLAPGWRQQLRAR